MSALETIAGSRSIRKLKDSPIPETILDAALMREGIARSKASDRESEMMAAVSFGFTDEVPAAGTR